MPPRRFCSARPGVRLARGSREGRVRVSHPRPSGVGMGEIEACPESRWGVSEQWQSFANRSADERPRWTDGRGAWLSNLSMQYPHGCDPESAGRVTGS